MAEAMSDEEDRSGEVAADRIPDEIKSIAASRSLHEITLPSK